MKESFGSDSNEDFYYTTTTDIFDFTATDTLTDTQVAISATSKSVFSGLGSFLKSLGLGLFSLSTLVLEMSVFLFVLLSYCQRKVLRFIHVLDLSKDKVVSGLMWRRGLLFRPATHGGVMVIVALAIVAGGLFSRGQVAAQDLTAQESVLKSSNNSETIVPTNRPRSEVLNYTVADGDTLSTVSEKFGISIDTVKWANSLANTDTIHPSDKLKIPPVTGVVYTVKAGDSLDSIAKNFSADKQTIADFPFNYIDETLAVKVGQTLYVPNGSIPQPVVATTKAVFHPNITITGSGFLSWPVPKMISQYFSWFHAAIDIDPPYGTPIYAAHAGTIIEAKKQNYSFGWYCIEGFGDGWTLAYAHMSAQACYVGEEVSQGQYLGAVGMTGFATGPHLHFEVRHNGSAIDPMTLLP